MSSVLQIMRLFAPDKLVEVFAESYIYFHGEKKVKEIFQKIESSPKVLQYIQQLIIRNEKPSAEYISHMLNSIGYFMFYKGETLCLGGLALITLWQHHSNSYIVNYGEDQDITDTCIDYILRCNKLKIHTGENCFSKFFNEINRIHNQA